MPVFPRAAATLLTQALGAMKVVVVTGQRQAGKSTVVEHHPALEGPPYFSLYEASTLRVGR